ncbi:hypothetical protein L6R52_39220, partial [Myxococcota bacterium]|nr:hypothetical protein [Myxococcota bacterium]
MSAIALDASVAAGAQLTASPSNYRAVLPTLRPGDTLTLSPGVYPGLPIHALHGTEAAPIVVTGPDSGPPAIIHGRPSNNTVSILDSSWVIIRNLEVDNQGNAGSGVKAEGHASYANGITIENLYLHNFAVNQQTVGISTKCPAWDWTIRNNRVVRAGTGIYLGSSDGTAPFVRGVIEGNVVVDPIGYGMEIKHQGPRPSLAGMPTGSSRTVVRHNVFSKATNASTGDLARPNLLVGHWPLSGPGQDDLYEIYGNLLYQNASDTEPLFQAEGNVAFYDNILINSFAGRGISIRPHNDVPRSIRILHNTLYVAGSGISVTGADPAFTQLVVGNAVFSGGTAISGVAIQRDNVRGTLTDAANELVHPSMTLGTADLYPRAGRLSGAAIDLSDFQDLTDLDDFNGTPRTGVYRGAYEGSGTNPGWTLAVDFKTLVGAGGATPDAGTPDASTPDASTPDAGPRDAGARD